MPSRCTAINLSDEQQCPSDATSANGLFCRLHAKQCYSMHKGYKLRNAKIDALDNNPPSWLAKKLRDTNLRNISFDEIQDEDVLNELHRHFFRKHGLLERVIRARKTHSKHFYSEDLDYGHKAYIDKLTNDRFVNLRALERLQRHTAKVLYAKRKWFDWVRQAQEEEDVGKENENARIKREAQLFRRHMKDVEARLKRKRQKEDMQRQAAFLEEAYRNRHGIIDEEGEEAWDPIEDAIEDDRWKFIDLMKSLLWLDFPNTIEDIETSYATKKASPDNENFNPSARPEQTAATAKTMNRNQKKRAKKQAKEATSNTQAEAAQMDQTLRIQVNESIDQMRERLLKGGEFYQEGNTFANTIDRPAELYGKVLGLPRGEVEKIIEDIGEIKQLLLCRLLLSFPALLRPALKADSLEAFFANPRITAADLRDLCLRLEQPSLQEIRDACADFARDDHEESSDEETAEAEDEQEAYNRETDLVQRGKRFMRPSGPPEYWQSRHEKEIQLLKGKRRKQIQVPADSGAHIDFGELDEDGKFVNKKIRIKVCGRSIWNYPSEKTLPRGGWLHFSILANGTRFADAVELCRSWDEFFELNTLAIYGYFPSTSWGEWSGNQGRSQFLRLSFIPRTMFMNAEQMSSKTTTGGSRSLVTRSHSVVEYKNFIVAHIKRNDPASRRFIQYLNLWASELCLLVRDPKTGRILVSPPEDQLWLVRRKTGLGRASKNEWDVVHEVGEDLFKKLHGIGTDTEFRFSFQEHFEVIVWDTEPGRHYATLQNRICGCLIKAYRFTCGKECYSVAAATLKTVHRERESKRCRDVRPGEMSIWDDLNHPNTACYDQLIDFAGGNQPQDMTAEEKHARYYNEIDTTEDEVLFPEELQGKIVVAVGDHSDRISRQLEANGPNMARFVHGLDTDDDSEGCEEKLERSLIKREKKQVKESKRKGQPRSKTLGLKNSRFQNNELTAVSPPRFTNARELQESLQAALERRHNWRDYVDSSGDDEYNDEDLDGDWEDQDDALVESSLTTYVTRDEERIGDGIYEEDLELVESDERQLKRLKQFAFSDPPDREDTEKQFAFHMDREKAKAFKPQWHAADFEPGAMERYAELQRLKQECLQLNGKSSFMRGRCMQMLYWLDVHLSEHRLVYRDIAGTLAYVGIFFPNNQYINEIGNWRTGLAARTKIVDNVYKSTQPPYYRDWRSTMTMPETFWPPAQDMDPYRPPEGGRPPMEWDTITRPQIARLYKAGIIAPVHESDATGRAVAIEDPMTGQKTMFVDYRRLDERIPDSAIAHITDFRKVDLIGSAQAYALLHPQARFALLRVWSHSHFWPLMVGFEARLDWSFEDYQGRSWQWKFYPKERVRSELSMQHAVDLRLKRWYPQLGKNVKVRRDIILVMGDSQVELEKMTTGVVFALQTAPWRLEVNFWRSFVVVDLAFLESLDRKWVE